MRITKEDVDRIVQLSESGLNPADISAKLGIPRVKVWAVIRRSREIKLGYWHSTKVAGQIHKDRDKFVVPPEVIAARDYRLNEPWTRDRILFGDPPYSQSALGRRT
jgi:hypothetical protein